MRCTARTRRKPRRPRSLSSSRTAISTRASAMTTNLLGLDAQALEQLFAGLGEKPFRARQVQKWIHRRGAAEFAAMTDIAKALREKLVHAAAIEPPAVVGDS